MAEPTNVADAPQSVVNTDGTFTENWHEKYGEENAAHLSRYKDFDGLVNSHIDTKKKFGKNPDTLVEIPTETSPDEIKTAFRKAKGVPDSVDGYEYTMPTELAARLGSVSDEKMAVVREFAYKELELSPAKFQKLLDFYHTNLVSDADAADISMGETDKQNREKGVKALGKHFGQALTDRTLRSEAVMRKYGQTPIEEVQADGTKATVTVLEKLYEELPEIKNSPWLRIIFDNIAEKMSPDTLKTLTTDTTLTATNIKSQVADVRAEMDKIQKENPSNYKGNVKFKDLQRRKTELYKQMPA